MKLSIQKTKTEPNIWLLKIQNFGFQQLLENWWWVMVYIIRISAKNSKI